MCRKCEKFTSVHILNIYLICDYRWTLFKGKEVFAHQPSRQEQAQCTAPSSTAQEPLALPGEIAAKDILILLCESDAFGCKLP